MGLFDGILNQVKNTVVQAGKEVVREQANDIAAREAKKAEAFALKKFLISYMEAMDKKYGEGEMSSSPEAKAFMEQHISKIIDNLQKDEFDETEMANDLNYVTNMIYRSMGKPETACSTSYQEAMQELLNTSKDLSNQAGQSQVSQPTQQFNQTEGQYPNQNQNTTY